MAFTEVLFSVVIEQLIVLLVQEASPTWCSRSDIENLKQAFEYIQTLMKDARTEQAESIQNRWLREIKDLAYDMEDLVYDMENVLDEWITKMLIKSQLEELEMAAAVNSNSKKMMIMMLMMKKKKKEVFSFLASSLCCCFSSSSSSIRSLSGGHDHNNNIGSRIRDIQGRLNSVPSMRGYFDSRRFLEIPEKHQRPPPPLKTASLIDISDVVCGRAIDKDIIMNRLLGDTTTSSSSSSSTCTVLSHPIIVSIVGTGGIGKTTLAKLVFNDEKVKKHFEMTMWVCVSENFELCKNTLEIIGQARCSAPNPYDWNDLYRNLLQSVGNKRFLLVLDDVWSEDPNEWKLLMDAVNSGAQGSRVLVTTRNERVAKVMNTTYTHYLGTLSYDDCWSLVRRTAFVGREAEDEESLNEIGFHIAMKCKGLPLAAKTLGGILCFKDTIRDWEYVSDQIREYVGVDSFLIHFLRLSYDDLPSPLKGCFAYCSIFPKGHEMSKDVLIKLWMAQGFLNSAGEGEDLEMTGEVYFNNLVLRSFFQDLSKDKSGNIISCKMHDLLHDLAHCVVKEECYITQYNTDILNSRSNIRHLSLTCEDRVDLSSFHATVLNDNAKHLRTFQLLTNKLKSPFRASRIIYILKCLRVLCFSKIGLENLSNEVGGLIHLRYLDLSGNCELRELPDSMANLYNLQTLELKGCRRLCKLPKEMGRMINLRHLNIENTPSLSYLPQGFGKLSSLRTLSRFIVSEGSKGCTIEELEALNHLKGKITIEGLVGVKTTEEASKAVLKIKKLSGLILDFKGNDAGTDQDMGTLMADRMEDVLAGLEPHPDLKEMEIRFYLGSKFPRWNVDSRIFLPLLNSLVLQDCINCTDLPDFGHLPNLETLIIHRLHNLKRIWYPLYSWVGKPGFPKLKHHEICDMKGMETWKLGSSKLVGEIMPCLRYVRLGCQNLREIPALWKLASLEILKIETTGYVKHIGPGFYCDTGRRVDGIAFPMLKHLEICDQKSLKVWDLGDGEEVGKILPCLSYLKLGCNKLKAFPALWKLPSLETLEIGTTGDVKHIGVEFHGNCDICDDRVAFPKLKELRISGMNLEVWDLGNGVVRQIMPYLRHVELDCPRMKVLPALGELQSLEILGITAEGIIKIGSEFYRNGCDEHATRVAFPNLKELYFRSMSSLEVWDLGNGVVRQIMTYLRHVELDCPKLKVLPALGELQSLEILGITAEGITKIGSEFYRNGCDQHATRVAFPNLKELYFRSMSSLEVWDLGEGQLMPCLRELKLNCPNLKVWPALERLPSLEVLDIVVDEEETHIGCEFYGLSTGERLHSWYEKIGGMGLWRIRRRRNH